jgi:hypothetical protein
VRRLMGYGRLVERQLHQRAAEAKRSQQVQFEQLAKNVAAGTVHVIDESAVVRPASLVREPHGERGEPRLMVCGPNLQDSRSAQRTCGWAPTGRRTTDRRNFVRGLRKSVLPLFSIERGFLGALICDKGVTTEVVDRFAREVLVRSVSVPPPHAPSACLPHTLRQLSVVACAPTGRSGAICARGTWWCSTMPPSIATRVSPRSYAHGALRCSSRPPTHQSTTRCASTP